MLQHAGVEDDLAVALVACELEDSPEQGFRYTLTPVRRGYAQVKQLQLLLRQGALLDGQQARSAHHLPLSLDHPEAGAGLTQVGLADVGYVCAQAHDFKLGPGVFGEESQSSEEGEAGYQGQEPGARDQEEGEGHPQQEHQGSGQLQDVAEGGGDVLFHCLGEQVQDLCAVALRVFADVVRSHGGLLCLNLKVHEGVR